MPLVIGIERLPGKLRCCENLAGMHFDGAHARAVFFGSCGHFCRRVTNEPGVVARRSVGSFFSSGPRDEEDLYVRMCAGYQARCRG